MSWLGRLVDRIRGKRPSLDPDVEQELAPGTAQAPAGEPMPTPALDLDRLLDRIQRGDPPAGGDGEIEDRVAQLADALAAAGHEREAAARLERLLDLRPGLGEMRLALARLFLSLGQEERAAPILEELLHGPGRRHRVEAHLALAEDAARRIGGEEGDRRALAHYEAVLAHDFGHSRARSRADGLHRRLNLAQRGEAAPTLLGAHDLGQGARYLIERELGRGGGGAVYLAHDQRLGRQVALKVLHPHVGRAAGAREHLFNEARIASALDHPRVITIHDLDEQLNMVVMEYCAGGTLASALPLGLVPALETLATLAGVLDLVHRCGVVHRDLKPRNLLLRRAGEPASLVLTDFGIAHAAIRGEGEEQDEAAAGSLVYMAPEQRRGEGGGAAVDLYACGVLLLEMLLGRPPLDGQQALQGVALYDLDEPWREAAEVAHSCPGALELARALVDPGPERRFGPAGALGRRASALAEEARQAARREVVRARLLQEHPGAQGELAAWLSDPWGRRTDLAGS